MPTYVYVVLAVSLNQETTCCHEFRTLVAHRGTNTTTWQDLTRAHAHTRTCTPCTYKNTTMRTHAHTRTCPHQHAHASTSGYVHTLKHMNFHAFSRTHTKGHVQDHRKTGVKLSCVLFPSCSCEILEDHTQRLGHPNGGSCIQAANYKLKLFFCMPFHAWLSAIVLVSEVSPPLTEARAFVADKILTCMCRCCLTAE